MTLYAVAIWSESEWMNEWMRERMLTSYTNSWTVCSKRSNDNSMYSFVRHKLGSRTYAKLMIRVFLRIFGLQQTHTNNKEKSNCLRGKAIKPTFFLKKTLMSGTGKGNCDRAWEECIGGVLGTPPIRVEKCLAEDVAQLTEPLPSTHRPWRSVVSTAKSRQGGSYLQGQR